MNGSKHRRQRGETRHRSRRPERVQHQTTVKLFYARCKTNYGERRHYERDALRQCERIGE